MAEKSKMAEKKAVENIAKEIESADEMASAAQTLQKAAQDLTSTMEKMRIAEYVQYLERPGKLLWTNFLIGLARGLGSTIGLTIVLAILFVVLQKIITLNLPFISEWLSALIYSIQENLKIF